LQLVHDRETGHMSSHRLVAALLLVLLASAAAMMTAAAWQHRTLSAASAASAAIAIIAASLHVNRPFWRIANSNHAPGAAETAVHGSTLLLAMIYGWGALAMLAVYQLSGLYWRHGWQYAAAMAIIAAAHVYVARSIASPTESRGANESVDGAVTGAALQGLAVAAGLLWLVGSGKLETIKGDWAANHIFIAGGFAVIFLTAIVVKTHAGLAKL
jgi:hypothetical protein